MARRPMNGSSRAGRVCRRRRRGRRSCHQHSAGDADRRRRPLGDGRSAAGLQRLVLHRAAAGGLPRSHAGAGIHRRRKRKSAPIDLGGLVTSIFLTAYLVFSYLRNGDISRMGHRRAGAEPRLDADRQPSWASRWIDWTAAIVSLVLCGYITVRYEPLTYELAMLPLEGIIGSAILIVLVLEGDAAHLRRRAGRHHPGDRGLRLHRPAHAGRFRHPPGLARTARRLSRPRHQRHDRRHARRWRC